MINTKPIQLMYTHKVSSRVSWVLNAFDVYGGYGGIYDLFG